MPTTTVKRELEEAIELNQLFGPANSSLGLRDLPADVLRETILSYPPDFNGTKRLPLHRVRIVGLLDLEAQCIGLRLWMLACELPSGLDLTQASLPGLTLQHCQLDGPLKATESSLRRSLRLDESTISGGVSLIGAEIGGQLIASDTTIEGPKASPEAFRDAVIADGISVATDVALGKLSAKGPVRLPGAKIGGQLILEEAELEGGPTEDGSVTALDADGAHIRGGVFCKKLKCKGETRLLGATVDGVVSLMEADFKARPNADGTSGRALEASRIAVSGELQCEGMSTVGVVRLIGAKVGGQLDLSDTRLASTNPDEHCLALVSAQVDELLLGFEEVTGTVVLTDTSVRSLWDAKEGKFSGELPGSLLMQGFHYESLREPLEATQRLDWIARSQGDKHYPDVYGELADAYRRLGRRSDARAVGIANERRARQGGGLAQRAWSYFLWKSVRYGYENWRAMAGLLVVIAAGALVFGLASDHFVSTTPTPPDFSPVIYATDTAIPLFDLGQTSAWAATGWLEWAELLLAACGYALVAAVVAGLAGIFKRDQV